MLVARLRQRAPPATLAEWLALGGAVALFGFVGWDGALWDARLQTLLHLMAIGAAAGMLALAARGVPLPRTQIEVPLLGLLAAYALATAAATNPGLSLRAMAAVLATTAMLPVALVALRRRPEWVALVATVAVFALAVIALLELLARRVAWYLAEGPGLLPPPRLPGEGSPFGSVAVAPFAILAVLPLTLLIGDPRLRRPIQIGLAAVGVPLTLLSGSRSAWLAIGVSAAVLAAPIVWRARGRLEVPRRWSARHGLAAVGVVVTTAAAAVFIAPRLTAVTSLVYRGNLWRDTLAAWITDPLFGIGPGLMPYARQAAAAPMSFPVRQPHSHNLALGVLGDAGLVGLAAAAVLVVAFAWVAGPWRSRSRAGRTSAAVLAGIGVAGLFEDLTFLPNFNLLMILLAAVALADAGGVRWQPLHLGRSPLALARLAPMAAGVLVLLLAMASGDAAAIAFRAGTDAAADLQWSSSASWLSRSTALDPWHPAAPRALAVAADAAGDDALARAAAERAVALNPGDGPSWTNLALLCLAQGDRRCAVTSAGRGVDTATLFGLEAVNAALVLEALGEPAASDRAYRLSLLTNPFTSLASDWRRPIALVGTDVPELDAQARELHLLLALHDQGEAVDPDTLDDPAVRALAAAMAGDRPAAEAALAAATESRRDSVLTWDVAAVLRRHWGEPLERTLAVAAVVRGGELPDPEWPPSVRRLTFDVASFRAYPGDELLIGAEHLLGERQYPWLLEALLTGR